MEEFGYDTAKIKELRNKINNVMKDICTDIEMKLNNGIKTCNI